MLVQNNPNEEDHQNSSSLVYDLRLSSVVPGRITGDYKSYDLKGMDLAFKLHYIKALFFFPNNNHNNNNNNKMGNNGSNFISIHELKPPMFEWLVSYYMACGRVREAEGRPFIKLNDSGIRVVEARSTKTVEEWLGMEGFLSLQDHLVYNHALGPDLGFTPLVFIQVTWFKCGGISVGLSWAHILGDVFSASTFMNMLGQYLQGHYQQAKILSFPDSSKPKYPPSSPLKEPISLKQVDPVGDHWVAPTNSKMVTHSFHLTSKQLDQLHSKIHGSNKYEKMISKGQCFEVISSIMWKSLAKIRKEKEPNVVTICRPRSLDREQVIPYNGQIIGTVRHCFPVSEADVSELMSLMVDCLVDESDILGDLVDKESGKHDFIVYGANLTFVDMEKVDVYGFELKGQCPFFASYSIGGVGEEGAVLVLPGPKDGKYGDGNGKLVIVILPEDELEGLKNEIKIEWSIV